MRSLVAHQKGPESRGRILRAPSHFQRPIASEASNALTDPLVPAGTSTCRRKRPGFPYSCYVPLSGRGLPIAHDDRLHTQALFAFSMDTIIIDRTQPPHRYASGRSVAQAVSAPLSFINSSIRSAMRCAGSRSCPTVHSAA